MTPEELRKLTPSIYYALSKYEDLFPGMKFKEFQDLELQPDKGYTAKTTIPLELEGAKAGNLVVLLLMPGDGTGAETEKYNLKNVTIHLSLKYSEKQWKVIPRPKDGVLYEGFFPLFSKTQNTKPAYCAASLDELIFPFGNNTIFPTYTLGTNYSEFEQAVTANSELIPKVQFTTINTEHTTFGNPHAIHYSRNQFMQLIGDESEQIIQVAGFLAITDQNSPLIKLIPSWHLPREHEAMRNHSK